MKVEKGQQLYRLPRLQRKRIYHDIFHDLIAQEDGCRGDHAELSVVCLDGHAVFLLPQSVASLHLSQFSSLFVLLTVRRALCLMRSAHPHTVRNARLPLALPVANALSADRKSTRLNSSHSCACRMPSSASKKHTTKRNNNDILYSKQKKH